MSAIAKIDNFGHKMIKIGKFQFDVYAFLANFSTVSNFLLGLYATIAILFPNLLYTGHYLVVRAIALGASFDAIDGKLARRSNTKPRLGAQFDTGADLVTFGFAPASLILTLFLEVNVVMAFLFAALYLFCASFRLSRFMIDPTTSRVGYFKGMPSPPAALFVIGWYVITDINLVFAAFHILFIGAIMISSFPYTAMRVVKTKFQKFNFIFTVSIMLLITYAPDYWMQTLAIVWIVESIYFGIFGPIHAYRTMEIEDE